MAGNPKNRPGFGSVSIAAADAFFRTPDNPQAPVGPPITPEQALAFAIVERAVADAFYASDYALGNSENRNKNPDFDPETIRGEARRWLVSDLSPWREDRGVICDMAGTDPDLIREFARTRLAEDRAAESAAVEAGTEYKRGGRRYPTRRDDNPNIIFQERESDLARLVELVELDREYAKIERAERGVRRAKATLRRAEAAAAEAA